MGIIKEYRIVMPVTVHEYRIAQIYMTARTQAMEAEQVSFRSDMLPTRKKSSLPLLFRAWCCFSEHQIFLHHTPA